MQPYNNSPKFFHWQNNESDLLGMLYSSLNRHHWSTCESIISRMLPFLIALRFMSFETFMSVHKISISLRVHNEQRSETKLFTKGFNSFSCPNQLTKVSALRCRKVNRNIKFDCDKSSLAFSTRLGNVVDQQSS